MLTFCLANACEKCPLASANSDPPCSFCPDSYEIAAAQYLLGSPQPKTIMADQQLDSTGDEHPIGESKDEVNDGGCVGSSSTIDLAYSSRLQSTASKARSRPTYVVISLEAVRLLTSLAESVSKWHRRRSGP